MSNPVALDFQPMLISEVFESLKASAAWYDKNKLERSVGEYPYVSRSGVSNGHESVVGRQDLPPNPGNAITIGVDTQTVFYQPTPFYTSVKIQILRHHKLNPFNGLVLVTLLRQQMSKFQWGNGASLDRLRATRIMVPVVVDRARNQVVDWEGMTGFGKRMFKRAATHARGACQSTSFQDSPLPELEFKPAFIPEVFESMRAASKWFDLSKGKIKGELKHPYVARSGGGNGVGTFVPHQGFDPPNAGNAITIGVSTSTVFYQPVPFYTSKEIQVLRHSNLDEFNGPLLVAIIREQMSKFQWGNGASLQRLRATRIMVPHRTNGIGVPVVDWEGMSQYGRVLRLRVEKKVDLTLQPSLGAILSEKSLINSII